MSRVLEYIMAGHNAEGVGDKRTTFMICAKKMQIFLDN
jgi:hypothetical protein